MSDYDTNNAEGVIVVGTAGNDKFTNHSSNVTIAGGAGDDSIYIDSRQYHGHNVLQYADGNGDDTVDGWLSNSILCVEGSYTRATVGSDAVIYVGNGSITFTGQGRQYSSEINVETVPAGTFSQHPTPCIRLRPQRQAAVRTLRQRAVRLRRLMQIQSSTRAVIKVYGITQENP